MDLINKVIELDNNEKYIVSDMFKAQDKTILVLGKISKKEEVSDILFAEMIDNKVKRIVDTEFIEQLKAVCRMNLK